ncbi:hypothetical protein AB0D29_09070 [Streptomyces sp. NPDC048424]|uniref:hypothetical protein n=1 Tax=Streptomyces sp. NPDC048424 TaxID=3155265 RepID=UPI0034267537
MRRAAPGHAGHGTRVHAEVRELGRELALVPELAGTHVRNEVAIVFDWENWCGART